MEYIEIRNNNKDHGVCVKEKMDALGFSSDYIKTKYFERHIQNLEDHIYEEAHPSPLSHELILQDCLGSENGNGLWEAYLKSLKKMMRHVVKKNLLIFPSRIKM
jgi:hypothetical protein